MRILITCACGNAFLAYASRLAQGRGKYCSRACLYAHRTRPSGLTYTVANENAGWFRPGEARYVGDNHPLWAGEDVSYKQLHRWVRSVRGAPGKCEHCDGSAYTEWANRSHEYRRDADDWLALCRRCHWAHDRATRGAATRRYGREAVQRG